ncbi:MAG: type II toxin-antitoxin system death-on-curing family toxin [Bryobacteraceae bacterium]
MSEPEWIGYEVVLAIHSEQLAEHGGPQGIRDQALLEFALAGPKTLYHYSADVTFSQLAAAYALGITANHPFIDGNKRTAWTVCAVFLELNGNPVMLDQSEVVEMMVGIAGGAIGEQQFANWLSIGAADF